MDGLKLESMGNPVEGAITAAVLAHRDLVNTLRLAVSVLTYLPEYMKVAEDSDQDGYEEFRAKQVELVRIAKLYAAETLLSGLGIDDVIALLREGLGGSFTEQEVRDQIAARSRLDG